MNKLTPNFTMPEATHRVCIVLGTRPEAIKLAPVIQLFKSSPTFDTQVILTGQHREMVEQVMRMFDLKADRDLAIMQHQQTLTDITSRSLQGLEALFKELQPQIVLVSGRYNHCVCRYFGCILPENTRRSRRSRIANRRCVQSLPGRG